MNKNAIIRDRTEDLKDPIKVPPETVESYVQYNLMHPFAHENTGKIERLEMIVEAQSLAIGRLIDLLMQKDVLSTIDFCEILGVDHRPYGNLDGKRFLRLGTGKLTLNGKFYSRVEEPAKYRKE
jgi:hypothetical protein